MKRDSDLQLVGFTDSQDYQSFVWEHTVFTSPNMSFQKTNFCILSSLFSLGECFPPSVLFVVPSKEYWALCACTIPETVCSYSLGRRWKRSTAQLLRKVHCATFSKCNDFLMMRASSFSLKFWRLLIVWWGSSASSISAKCNKIFFFFVLNVPEDCSFAIHVATFGSLYNFVNVFVFLATGGESSLTGLMFIFSSFTVITNVRPCLRVFLCGSLSFPSEASKRQLWQQSDCVPSVPRPVPYESNLLDPVVGKWRHYKSRVLVFLGECIHVSAPSQLCVNFVLLSKESCCNHPRSSAWCACGCPVLLSIENTFLLVLVLSEVFMYKRFKQ